MKLVLGKFTLCLAIIPFLASCSSGLKKSCESANWYVRGENMAKQGKFPDSDFYLKKCTAAGAAVNHQQLDRGFKSERERVCNQTLALQTGRKGSKYDFPLCLNYNEGAMKSSYKKGLMRYCSPAGAKAAGLSGQVYEKVCPSNMEADFLASYNPSYKKYFANKFKNETAKKAKAETKIKSLEQQKKKLKLQQSQNYGNPNYKIQRELKTINFQIQDLKSEINVIDESIEKLNSKN